MEQIAVLALAEDEWIFVAEDDGEPERSWTAERDALAELKAEGWQVAQGPLRIVLEVPGQERREVVGYELRRNVH